MSCFVFQKKSARRRTPATGCSSKRKSNANQRNKRNESRFRHKSFAPGRCSVDRHQGAGGLKNIAQGLRATVRSHVSAGRIVQEIGRWCDTRCVTRLSQAIIRYPGLRRGDLFSSQAGQGTVIAARAGICCGSARNHHPPSELTRLIPYPPLPARTRHRHR